MMGGAITLTSEVGTGTCFTIVFQGVPVAAVHATSSKEAWVDDQQIFFEQATVLVVDDIRQNRLLIKAYFQKTNLSVIEAETGEQAIRSAQQHKPDIILIDLRMPVMDGYEATRKIRNLKSEIRDVPIIAITASAMKQDEENIKAYGFDGYLRKPVNRAEVFQEIARFLPHSRREIPSKQAESAESSPKISAAHLRQLPELIKKLENNGMI
jgi:CheY-like chemotaxis protein